MNPVDSWSLFPDTTAMVLLWSDGTEPGVLSQDDRSGSHGAAVWQGYVQLAEYLLAVN